MKKAIRIKCMKCSKEVKLDFMSSLALCKNCRKHKWKHIELIEKMTA